MSRYPAIVAWCDRQGLAARLIPEVGGSKILDESPDGPGWVVQAVTFAQVGGQQDPGRKSGRPGVGSPPRL